MCEGKLSIGNGCPEIASPVQMPDYHWLSDWPAVNIHLFDGKAAVQMAIINGWKMNLQSFYHFMLGSGKALSFSLTDALDGKGTHPKPVGRGEGSMYNSALLTE